MRTNKESMSARWNRRNKRREKIKKKDLKIIRDAIIRARDEKGVSSAMFATMDDDVFLTWLKLHFSL